MSIASQYGSAQRAASNNIFGSLPQNWKTNYYCTKFNVKYSFLLPVLCCAFKIFICTKMFVKDYLKHLLNLGSSVLFQSHDCLVTYLRFRGILIKFQGVISFTLLNFVLLLNVPLYMYNPEKLHVISRGLIL